MQEVAAPRTDKGDARGSLSYNAGAAATALERSQYHFGKHLG